MLDQELYVVLWFPGRFMNHWHVCVRLTNLGNGCHIRLNVTPQVRLIFFLASMLYDIELYWTQRMSGTVDDIPFRLSIYRA
jgi:hypothetical protein